MEVSFSAFYAWVKSPGDPGWIRKREVLEANARQLFLSTNKPMVIGGYQMR